jgi:DNA processing protein
MREPPILESSRKLDWTPPRVAIVGSRKSHGAALSFGEELAKRCVEAGAIVLSGGAEGMDTAAHRGALKANGRTWVIASNGSMARMYPAGNAELFDAIRRSEGAIVWPFSPYTTPGRGGKTFKQRNEVLVALADVVVVVQAGTKSGTLHTANRALAVGKPVWVVPYAPSTMRESDFGGTCALLERPNTRVFRGYDHFFENVGQVSRSFVPRRADPTESAILQTLARAGQALHRDHVAARANVRAADLSVALFTLMLEGLVRETNGYVELT